jgi:hypothetical protein
VKRGRGRGMRLRLSWPLRQRSRARPVPEPPVPLFLHTAGCGCATCRTAGSVYDSTQTAVARSRARTRLLEALTPEQGSMYGQRGYFYVTGASGTRYRIRHGTMNNISAGDMSYCIGPAVPRGSGYFSYPVEDYLLAQALMILTDERAFLKIARSSHE